MSMQTCYNVWKENKALLPVKGLDYPDDFAFRCEGSDCQDSTGQSRTDRSTALHWFFEKDHSGLLLCEECHCQLPYLTTVKICRARIRALRAEGLSKARSPHPVRFDDCVHRQLAGFLQYCRRIFNFNITGLTPGERGASIKTIAKSRRLTRDVLGLSTTAALLTTTSTRTRTRTRTPMTSIQSNDYRILGIRVRAEQE